MAVKFPFVSAFLCERVLQEQNNIISAIRIVDVFQIPQDVAQQAMITFFAVVALKTVPVPDARVNVRIAMCVYRESGRHLPIRRIRSCLGRAILIHPPPAEFPS